MGSDGIAISSDGSRLYYCPLSSRKLYSVDTDVLADRALDEGEVAAAVTNEGDRGGASDGLRSRQVPSYRCGRPLALALARIASSSWGLQ